MSNDGEVMPRTAVGDEPQADQSSNLQECPHLTTGSPFPQFSLPVFENEGDLPYITEVFSLGCKEISETGKRSDPMPLVS